VEARFARAGGAAPPAGISEVRFGPIDVRLGVISARYPYGAHEPYLDAELRALAPHLDSLTVIPTSPRTSERGYADVPGEVVRVSLFGRETLSLAARTLVRSPRRTVAAVAALLAESTSWRVRLKNLAVLPKGLAVAELARVRRLEHLHAYWLSTPATVAWLAARIADIPFSATAHAWDIYEDNIAGRKIRDAAFVRAISERGRSDLLALTRGDPERVHVVRVGVALGDVRIANTNSVESQRLKGVEALRILCAAALVIKKGHRILLDALSVLRDRGVEFSCTLAGEGPLREEIVARISALALRDHVHLIGTVPHSELLERLARGEYDVSVLASIELGVGREGVPVSLMEAMAAGAVVVATNSGSIGELVDRTTGVIVPHSDARALADGLANIAADAALRERLREAARERVTREFDIVKTTARLRLLLSGTTRDGDSPEIVGRHERYMDRSLARGGPHG
jgi:colanic acid/amylovoran biosynthesis glycosyltransferase